MVRSRVKFLIRIALFGFILLNVIAAFHAWQFTHFSKKDIVRTKDPDELSVYEKSKTLVIGVSNPKPQHTAHPSRQYDTVQIQSNVMLEAWHISVDSSKGTVALFHGFSGNKSLMLQKSNEFNILGYNTLLVDLMGSGGSEGYQTTIGYREGDNVKDCYSWLVAQGESNIHLYGTSMGAVAIMKALHSYDVNPNSVMLEYPFGSMYKTVSARFKMMNVPSFPMAGLLVFWGGIFNGFWAFNHNPVDYAKAIKCPALLMCGAQDPKVSRKEIDEIYENLKGKKQLSIFKEAGHDNLMSYDVERWRRDVLGFLK